MIDCLTMQWMPPTSTVGSNSILSTNSMQVTFMSGCFLGRQALYCTDLVYKELMPLRLFFFGLGVGVFFLFVLAFFFIFSFKFSKLE